MKRIRQFIGGWMVVTGLGTIYVVGQLTEGFEQAAPVLATAAVVVIAGYSLAGWHRP